MDFKIIEVHDDGSIMAARAKSVSYPSATWSESIELLEKLASLGGRPVSVDILAQTFGLKNPKTKSFQAKLTSARLYGLISVKNGTVGITDDGDALIHPVEDDVRPLELSLFSRPKLYGSLLEAYEGRSLPRIDLFENILVKEYDISEVSKKRAARCFITSAEELNVLVNGVVGYGAATREVGESNDSTTVPPTNEGAIEGGRPVSSAASARVDPGATSNSASFCMTIPIKHGDGFIEIKVPENAYLSDLEMAQRMLEVYVKSKGDRKEDA